MNGWHVYKKYYRLSKTEAIVKSLDQGARLGEDGQVCVLTGDRTGRSASDKFIVKKSGLKDVQFGDAGAEISEENYNKLISDLKSNKNPGTAFVHDFIAGPAKVRLITDSASHVLFVINMFKEAPLKHKEVDLLIVCFPLSYVQDPEYYGLKSKTFIVQDLVEGQVVIGGTKYAGEIKKSVFSYLSYMFPDKDILPMHSSVTTDTDGDNSAVFFGLSGTGKTTLSADPKRKLVGDDEHGWSEKGLFNFEAGCYAKVIKLSRKNEPMIWDASNSFSTLLENVEMHPKTGTLDFHSSKYTENTRSAYPLEKINNAHEVGFTAPPPKNIIMLTCDAYGVLPSVSKLTPEGAAYHFISGYTAKVAGTEKGVTGPVATFSALFGSPFMPLKVSRYADLLIKKIEKHKPNVWLVNTGWVGGGPGVGNRIPLPETREIVNSILDGSLKDKNFVLNETFNLSVPDGMDPKKSWTDQEQYDKTAQELVMKFKENAKKFSLSNKILKAGMP